MKQSKFLLTVFGILVFAGNSLAFGQETNAEWKQDPVCQAVFFGVLEGLYRDNVSAEVVASVIGAHDSEASMDERLKRSFVVDCPLCEPAFHAFLAYQAHKQQTKGFDLGGEAGLDEKVAELLMSDDTKIRLQAMHVAITKWVDKKFEAEQLTGEQIAAWQTRVMKRFDEGKSELIALMDKDEHYKDWSPYWGCAACNGCRDAAKEIGK